MGHRLLHQSHAAGGIGAIPARSANSHDSVEKVKAGGRKAPPQPPKTLARFVILQDSARYPSGPRERSAKPPFVGSNPTRASTFLRSGPKEGGGAGGIRTHEWRFCRPLPWATWVPRRILKYNKSR